jgi:protein gp37
MFDRLPEGRWWDRGLQLVEGCTIVSPGCDNCWSLAAANMRRFNPNSKMAARYEGTVTNAGSHCVACQEANYNCTHHPGPPTWTGRVNPQWQDLDKIGRARKPQVYTFWNDLFHPGVEEDFVTSVMLRILTHPQHFYIICTKRPARALEYFRLCYDDFNNNFEPQVGHAPNWRRLMLMTTAENQEMADLRVPILSQIPGVLHGVSVEPGLGVVDLTPWFTECIRDEEHQLCPYPCDPCDWEHGCSYRKIGLDWVVCGGETGPNARPMHPDIPCKLRDDCVAAGTPFFFKSWGEWVPVYDTRKRTLCVYNDGRSVEFTREAVLREEFLSETEHNKCNPVLMSRVGKKGAGRLLNGHTWDEVPPVNKEELKRRHEW